jgi:hypothetical protein
MGWDDQTRGLHSIHKFTYKLDMDKEDGIVDDQTRGLHSIHKFMYSLNTDKECYVLCCVYDCSLTSHICVTA